MRWGRVRTGMSSGVCCVLLGTRTSRGYMIIVCVVFKCVAWSLNDVVLVVIICFIIRTMSVH